MKTCGSVRYNEYMEIYPKKFKEGARVRLRRFGKHSSNLGYLWSSPCDDAPGSNRNPGVFRDHESAIVVGGFDVFDGAPMVNVVSTSGRTGWISSLKLEEVP